MSPNVTDPLLKVTAQALFATEATGVPDQYEMFVLVQLHESTVAAEGAG